jgi:hygromycin-B 7''-O-kinase
MTRLELHAIRDAAAYRRHFDDDHLWQRIATNICARHHLAHTSLRRSTQGANIIFFVDERYILKIYAPFFRNEYSRECASLEFAYNKYSIKTPEIIHTGDIEGWSYIVMTRLAGHASRETWASVNRRDRLEIISRLGFAMREWHTLRPPLTQAPLNRDWQTFIEHQARTSVERQQACNANTEWLVSLPAYIAARLALLPVKFAPVLLHGDVHAGNLLLEERGGRWQIAGLIDFGDSFCGFHEYEFVAPGVLMVQGDGELQRAMLLAYGYTEAQLDIDLRARLMLLTILYEWSDLRKYAERLAPEAVNLTLDELERAIWKFTN